jgi:hypothetical protein
MIAGRAGEPDPAMTRLFATARGHSSLAVDSGDVNA